METQVICANNPTAIDEAISLLKQGHPVAFPTDTVYGLGVLAQDYQGIERLFIVKGRDTAKAIAVLIGQVEHLALVTSGLSETASRLAQRFWPGALTLVVERHPSLPDNLSPLPTVGVRMPDHPVALELLRRAGPMAVTSANLSGAANACSAEEVRQGLQGRIRLILDGGATPGGSPSTVIDCTQEQLVILRAGPITQQQIQEALA